MTTSPILGFTDLTEGQALPATQVNEMLRRVEQGGHAFSVIDEQTTPPGSPNAGDAYLVTATATSDWTGWEDSIAYYLSGTGWFEIAPLEGMMIWVQDVDLIRVYDGANWNTLAGSDYVSSATASEVWQMASTTVFLSPSSVLDASAFTSVSSSSNSITLDCDTGSNFTCTLTENTTLQNPSNLDIGQGGIIVVTQDGMGSRTMAYGTQWKFPGGASALSTSASAVDMIAYTRVTASIIVANLTLDYQS